MEVTEVAFGTQSASPSNSSGFRGRTVPNTESSASSEPISQEFGPNPESVLPTDSIKSEVSQILTSRDSSEDSSSPIILGAT